MGNDGNMKALVIEDDPEMAGLVKGLLRRRFSIEADIAEDCAAARRMLSETGYDIITLDYRLPDGAGLDLLDEITDSREHPPVIMVTGHGDEETAARSFRSRASGYVVKDSRLPDMLTKAVGAAVADLSMKRMEKELVDEKAFIENVIDSLSDIFAVLDIEGNLLRWNRRLREVTGYSEAELASLNILDLFAPEGATQLASGMSEMKNDGAFAVDELALFTRTGEKRIYELSGRALLDRNGVPIGFFGIGRDTTERKGLELRLEEMVEERTAELAGVNARLQQEASELELARQALAASEQQLRAVFENSLDSISVFNSEGVFVSTNEASARITGYPPEELVGKSIFELVHPDDIPALQEAIIESVSSPGLASVRVVRVMDKSGNWLALETVGQSFLSPEGETKTVVNARDATERRRAEQELLRLNSELEGYAYAVSHDLKTPLTSIKLAGETLLRSWEKRAEIDDIGAEIRRISEIIARSASQAERLIGDLLSLAVAGREPEEVSELDVAAVVRRVLEDRGGLLKERSAEVRLDSELGTVKANPSHVYQLFGNLIDNAVRHNDKTRPLVEVSYLGELPSGHTYTVKDNGPGIPPGDAERVFLPFFKGENGSTGIGLAIVDKIVRLYGGSVGVRGNGGACFEFSIKDLNPGQGDE